MTDEDRKLVDNLRLRNLEGLLFDECHRGIISKYSWCNSGRDYAVTHIRTGLERPRQRTIFLHCLIMESILGRTLREGEEVDHINRNKLDCRSENLRVVSRAQNNRNVGSRRGSGSEHRGVYWDRAWGKWRAQVQIDGRKIHVGYFVSERDAAEAARKYRVVYMPGAVD